MQRIIEQSGRLRALQQFEQSGWETLEHIRNIVHVSRFWKVLQSWGTV